MTNTDIKNSRIVGIIGAVLVVFSVSVNFAFADTFSRTPSGNGTYQEMTFNVTIDDVSSCTSNWSIFGVQFDPSFAEFPLGENVPTTENTHVFNTQFSSNYNVQQITAGCDGSGGSLSSLEFDGFNNLFSIEPYVAPTTTPTTTPTGGGISFIDFNDITPSDMLASVRQGTVETTGKTLPLLVFLGIPLGFLLVLLLIGMINKTLTPETSLTSRRGNGRGWTAHGVMEHDLTEFKKKERSRIKRDL